MSDILDIIKQKKIITIVRGVDEDKLTAAVRALCDGGIGLLEITFDAKGIVSAEKTAKIIAEVKGALGNKLHIGAGTVLNTEQVRLAEKAGAEFILSPNLNKNVITETKKLGMLSIPGAFTPTEVSTAYNSGADLVKLFPADMLGIPYIKAVRAPLSHIPLLAVGGVNDKNLKDYLATGVIGVGIGSGIIDKELINKGDFAALTELARRYTSQI